MFISSLLIVPVYNLSEEIIPHFSAINNLGKLLINQKYIMKIT